MTQTETKTGTILDILRMSTEDGPGIRTTVFFKGCPLSCLWCHNPESISPKPQIQWMQAHCIGCGTCVKTCPAKALSQSVAGVIINRLLCRNCGLCTRECPATAMELLGEEWTMQDLADELVKDRVYFDHSGGGVTLSGGEAALQTEYCLDLLKELRSRGIQTALDTCGHIAREKLACLLPYVDILLYDLKEIDTDKHKRFTGTGNERILANAIFAADYKKNHPYPKTLWIRTPVIPDATDTPENIKGLGDFIRDNLMEAVDRWELCAFNNLCRDKYERLDMIWAYAKYDLPSRLQMDNLIDIAKSRVPSLLVCRSGPTRLEHCPEDNSIDPKQPDKLAAPRF
ncbi:MAG: glycyl-radical enzyme activating protein [Smithellaceae bacterium]